MTIEKLIPVTFATKADFSIGSNPTQSVTVADFNGDGKADLVTKSGNSVAILLGNGRGGFATATTTSLPAGTYLESVNVGDFNADGKIDLVAGNYYNVSIFLGNGRGGFAVPMSFTTGGGINSFVSIGDFNTDGNVDLVSADASGSGKLSISLGDGKGNFTTQAPFAIGDPRWVVKVGDFNADNNADLVTVNASSNSVSVLLGDGQGNFSAPTSFAVGSYPQSVTIGDFNSDGKADLATANVYGNSVSILLGDAQGGFGTQTTFAVVDYPTSINVGDFNADGKTDLVTANQNSNNVSVLLGDGAGGFSTPTTFAVGAMPYYISVADFNADGKSDLVTANYQGKNVSVLLNTTNSATVIIPPTNYAPTGNVTISGSAQQNQTLTVSNTLADADGLGAITYQWQANGVNLGKGNSYTLTNNEVSKTIKVIASYIDGLGNVENVTSAATTAVTEPTNHTPIGDVIITGNAVQGQTLTASNTLTDADGLGAINYLWQVNDINLGTGNSYILTSNEIGKTVTATATYTDGLGKTESVTSADSDVVTAPTVAGFTISPVTQQTTGENGATASYSIHLNTAPLINQDVVITFTSSDTSEGIINNPTLTFTSTNYAIPQTLTVQGVDDYLDDGDIPYQVTTKVSTTDVFYKSLTINPFSLTNADDGLDKALDLYGDEGGSKIDVLIGGNGADKLHGLNMADDLSGGLGNDSLWGGYGDDNLHGNEGDDKLNGEQENDLMEGGTGNDTLDGGDGVDTMIGGAGNDTYYLGYDAADVIDDQGLPTDVDTVIMPYQLTSYTLPTGIENGTIAAGTQASGLTGNDSDNSLTGNDGKNKLIGAVGRDSLFGGLGDDVLIGGTGNDVLEGGTGKDNLTGGAGKDTFLFNTAIKANVDKIIDFKPIDDTLTLENQVFTKLTATGVLNTDNFVTATAAHDSNDYLIYNKASGALSYDADGNGAGAGIQIAMIGSNLALTSADFVVI